MNGENKPVALVLGGTFPHAELLRKLKARGYYTILVDYYDNPPAAYAADEHSTASALDFDAVLDLARERGAELVMSSCLDQQLSIAMRVSEALGLPHPFSSELARVATNKRLMKQVMIDNGIPTSRHYPIAADGTCQPVELDYPVMVKPVDNSGSAGVFKLDDSDELAGAVALSRKWSRTGEVVVEEYKRGMEVSVYAYVGEGDVTLVTTAQRISVVDDVLTRCFSTMSPARLTEAASKALHRIALQIMDAFGLENTPLFFQTIVDGDEVSVIELSPRMGGGLSYRTMQLNVDFDLMEASIDSYLGRGCTCEPGPERGHYLIHLLYGKNGTFDHLEGGEQLLSEGVIEEIHLMKTKGMEISTEKSSSSRSAVMLIEGETERECLDKLDEAMARLEIRDPNGNPLLDRSLHLTEELLEESRHASSKA